MGYAEVGMGKGYEAYIPIPCLEFIWNVLRFMWGPLDRSSSICTFVGGVLTGGGTKLSMSGGGRAQSS